MISVIIKKSNTFYNIFLANVNTIKGDNMLLYIIIFISKVLENSVATLRIIVVANGKKILGAILQGIVSIIWICVTGMVVINVLKDPFKIIAFALGSTVGSYLGSYIEEKIALGNKMLTIISRNKLEGQINNRIKSVKVISTHGYIQNKKINISYIIISRKKINKIISIIKDIDKNSLIISNNIVNLCPKQKK